MYAGHMATIGASDFKARFPVILDRVHEIGIWMIAPMNRLPNRGAPVERKTGILKLK